MAFSATSYLAPQFQSYKFNWIKFYEPGTTTPKSMATDSTGGTLIAKAQVNNKGFFETAGGTVFIPFVNGAYDAYLFPTEAEADANDTSNAIRIADNIVSDSQDSADILRADLAGGTADIYGVTSKAVGDYFKHDNVAAMVAASITAGDRVGLNRYYASGELVAGLEYLVKTAAQAAADGDVIDELGGGFTLANTNVAILIQEGIFELSQFGAKNDIADNTTHTALQYIADNRSGFKLTPGVVYNLNGNTLALPSGFFLDSTLASTIKNGTLNCHGTSYTGNTIGDLNLVDCDSRIGGGLSLNNHGTKFKIGRIVSDDRVRLQYMSDFEIEHIRVDMPISRDSADQRAMGYTQLYEGTIGGIHMSGHYAMGFETAGNGSDVGEYASKNVSIGSIISDRNPAATSGAGLHGVYMHGCFNVYVASILSTGFAIGEQGTSNDFKFRDNWDSKIDKLTCLTVQLSSDANSETLNSFRNNTLNNILLAPDPANPDTTGKMTATVAGAGLFNNNTINNFKGEFGTSGTLPTDGDYAIKMTGNIIYTKDGDIQLSNIVYYDARVVWGDADTNYYTRALVAHNTHFVSRIRIQADLSTFNSRLEGGVRFETSGGTRTITHQNCTIETDWDTINSTGTANAEIGSTDIKVDRPGSTLRPNGTVRYRFLSFNNGYYLASDDDSNFVTFP